MSIDLERYGEVVVMADDGGCSGIEPRNQKNKYFTGPRRSFYYYSSVQNPNALSVGKIMIVDCGHINYLPRLQSNLEFFAFVFASFSLFFFRFSSRKYFLTRKNQKPQTHQQQQQQHKQTNKPTTATTNTSFPLWSLITILFFLLLFLCFYYQSRGAKYLN